MRLRWKTPAPSPNTSLWSEVGDGIDYYFVYGPELDAVVAGYRARHGPGADDAALGVRLLAVPRALQDAAGEPRRARRSSARGSIPLDVIVQDWQYWPIDAWGSHQFDPARFPDPDAWIAAIHAKHARLMISVWGKFYPATANFKAMHGERLSLRSGR